MLKKPTGLVLLYHRIAALDSDPQLLAVTPQHFARHLEILKERCHPMPLRELVEGVKGGTLPDRAVALTFDDGYADNLENGKPLLERYEVPATIFLTTSYLGGQREFWWDDLERLLLLAGELPRILRLRVRGSLHEWDLDGAGTFDVEDYKRHEDWNVERPEEPTTRHHVYRCLCRLLRTLSSEERDATLVELSAAAGATPDARPTHRVLTPDEVAHLARSSVIDVGAHTATHSVLSALPLTLQQAEIYGSRARLQEITGGDVTSFAYPFGGHSDYTRDTVALVREAGFTSAFSASRASVRSGADPFRLPRIVARDWDAVTFSERLQGWL